MRLRFLAKTMPRYEGHDGKGGALAMKRDDSAEMSDDVANALRRRYPRDFAQAEAPKEHAPEANKLAPKTDRLKSK